MPSWLPLRPTIGHRHCGPPGTSEQPPPALTGDPGMPRGRYIRVTVELRDTSTRATARRLLAMPNDADASTSTPQSIPATRNALSLLGQAMAGGARRRDHSLSPVQSPPLPRHCGACFPPSGNRPRTSHSRLLPTIHDTNARFPPRKGSRMPVSLLHIALIHSVLALLMPPSC